MVMVSKCKSWMTSMVLGDSTLKSLTPSVNTPLCIVPMIAMCVVDILTIVIFKHTIFALWLPNGGRSTIHLDKKKCFHHF